MYRIDRIDVYRVAMPLMHPWTTAYGSDDVVESLILRMAGQWHMLRLGRVDAA